jgi:magnesium transporter
MTLPHAWPKDSAAHRMTTKVPTARLDETLGEIDQRIAEDIDRLKSINYIYVLDAHGHLVGLLSMSDLYRHAPTVVAGAVCKRAPIVHVRAESHQERAAYLALQHNLKAIPVVDGEHTFLGAIPSDAILTILHKEMHEDYFRLVGVRHPHAVSSSVMELSLGQSLRHRLPWLLIGLLGGLLSAYVIDLFESTLAEHLVLASFIPLVVYMSGAVAVQTQAYIIRDIALGRVESFTRYLVRQLSIVFLIALTIGVILTGAAYLIHGHAGVSITLGLTLAIAIGSSVFTGLLTPFLFNRAHLDPADASGPITTIIQDLLSVAIYLGIATLLL